MKKLLKSQFLHFVLIALLLIAVIPVKNYCLDERIELNAKPLKEQAAINPSEVVSTKMLGPFRSFANISVWLRAIEYEEAGEFFELNTLYQLALQMQPRNPIVAGYLSDLFIYRISRKLNSEEQRWNSVSEGLKILEEGLQKIPNSTYLWDKYSIFFQLMTGEMPVRIISKDLASDDGLLQIVPQWYSQAEILVENIENLSEDESKRLENFTRNHGTAMTYGREYENFPQYEILSEQTQKLLYQINLFRAKLAFLAFYRATSEIGLKPYLFRHSMFRALEILRLASSEIQNVYDLSKDMVLKLKGIDISLIPELHQDVFNLAFKDFQLIENFNKNLKK